MTTDIKELVKRLREGKFARRQIAGPYPDQYVYAVDTEKTHLRAADALEAMAGEVEQVTALLRASRKDVAQYIRERDRLKAALEKFLAEADNAPKRIIGSGIGGQTMEATLQRAGRLVSEWQLGQLEEALGGDAS